MKTTLDIPDDLLQQIQAKARTQHRSVDDIVEDLPASALKADQRGDMHTPNPDQLREILEKEDLERFYDSTR